ncbi:MAG: hypothetical protein ACO4CG_13605, partial [Prochlorothrix sp.]
MLEFAAGKSRFIAVIAPIEVFVGGEEKTDKVENGKKRGNKAPTKEKLQDRKDGLTEIEVVSAKPTEEEGEENGDDFVTHGGELIDLCRVMGRQLHKGFLDQG